MRFGSREFLAPATIITAAYLFMGLAMIGLAVWQLQRADEKIALAEQAHSASVREPFDLNGDAEWEFRPGLSNYMRVRFHGQVLSSRQLFWDNRIHKGVAGYEVIAPVLVDSAGSKLLLLINRGWVPLGASRDSLPEVSLVEGSVEFAGIFTTPSRGFAGGEALDPVAASWPRVMQFFDYGALAAMLDPRQETKLLAGVVQQLQPVADQRADNTLLLPESFLFLDNWQPVAGGPAKHYGYAFQWFAMFAALSLIYFGVNTHRVASTAGTGKERT